MASSSWETIARNMYFRIFAERCERHTESPDPDNCAFCADKRAIDTYDAKAAGTSELSWNDVANVIARCLDAAYCGDHDKLDPDCPFCDDVSAYRAYVRKVESTGRRVVDRFEGTTSINIKDIPVNEGEYAEWRARI